MQREKYPYYNSDVFPKAIVCEFDTLISNFVATLDLEPSHCRGLL